MTQPNTERQALRRKSAIQSAVFSTVVQVTAAALLFWAHRNTDSAVVSAVLLVISLIDLGAVVPVWISLHIRLKEIQGGEDDAAAQY